MADFDHEFPNNLQAIASTVLGTAGISCLLISAHFFYQVFYQEIGEVNRKLPDDQQISYLWWYTEKILKLRTEYRRLYPDGNLHRLQFRFQMAGVVFLMLAGVAAGLIKIR